MKADFDTEVSIDYSFSTSEGRLLGSSDQSGPFSFVPGRGDAVYGLESRIIGMEAGQDFTFEIPAAEAYGTWDSEKIMKLHPDELEYLGEIQVGMRLRSIQQARTIEFVITSINDDEVILDGNHPLAGQDLVFTGKITGIRPAPEPSSCGCGSHSEGHSCGCGSDHHHHHHEDEDLETTNAGGCGCGGSCGCGGH